MTNSLPEMALCTSTVWAAPCSQLFYYPSELEFLFICHSIFKVVTILDVTVDIFLESYHFYLAVAIISFLKCYLLTARVQNFSQSNFSLRLTKEISEKTRFASQLFCFVFFSPSRRWVLASFKICVLQQIFKCWVFPPAFLSHTNTEELMASFRDRTFLQMRESNLYILSEYSIQMVSRVRY